MGWAFVPEPMGYRARSTELLRNCISATGGLWPEGEVLGMCVVGGDYFQADSGTKSYA